MRRRGGRGSSYLPIALFIVRLFVAAAFFVAWLFIRALAPARRTRRGL
jgi:hypothetical protein